MAPSFAELLEQYGALRDQKRDLQNEIVARQTRLEDVEKELKEIAQSMESPRVIVPPPSPYQPERVATVHHYRPAAAAPVQTGTVKLPRIPGFEAPSLAPYPPGRYGTSILSKNHVKGDVKDGDVWFMSREYMNVMRLSDGRGWALIFCPICGCNAKSDGDFLSGLTGVNGHVFRTHKEILQQALGHTSFTREMLLAQDFYTVLNGEQVLALQTGEMTVEKKIRFGKQPVSETWSRRDPRQEKSAFVSSFNDVGDDAIRKAMENRLKSGAPSEPKTDRANAGMANGMSDEIVLERFNGAAQRDIATSQYSPFGSMSSTNPGKRKRGVDEIGEVSENGSDKKRLVRGSRTSRSYADFENDGVSGGSDVEYEP